MTAPVATCEVHPARHAHYPVPRAQQDHHVIPRDWQRGGWAPAVAPYPGVYEAFGVHDVLWDARSIKVPPTCHLNVHVWIVAVMHELARLALTEPPTAGDVATAGYAVARANRLRAADPELDWAMQAPLRYLEAGGDVRSLIAARQWGAS